MSLTYRNTNRGSAAELARLARTVVAGNHSGLLTVGSGARQVAYLDDDGEPVLLCPATDPPSMRFVSLAVWGALSRRVVLGGHLLPLARQDSMVAELVGLHGPCFAEQLRLKPVRLLRLTVHSVGVEDAFRSHAVPAACFATAEPDLWAAFGAAVTAHLNESHADLVNRLAGRHWAGEPVVAAAISALGQGTVELAVITRSGGSQLRITMEERLRDPHDMCGRLRALAFGASSPGAPDGS